MKRKVFVSLLTIAMLAVVSATFVAMAKGITENTVAAFANPN